MNVRSMVRGGLAGALTLAAAAAYAGGFWLEVEAPNPADARMKDAVVVFHALGCHGPGSSVTATAEGVVEGKRKSIPLKLKPLGNDMYTASRQWPVQGRWVLAATAASIARGSNGGPLKITTSALIELTESGSLMTVKGKDNKNEIVVRRPERETLAQLVEKTLRGYETRHAGL